MGKSTLITHLLQRARKKFDLVISFIGTSACSPEMKTLMATVWDSRFQFSEWNQPLINALLKQQETLKEAGNPRQVCILVDDIILNGRDEESLSHLCLRGRHFNVSVLACAVSYTTLPKRCRRALDTLFLFSCPMAGDCQILCSEYAHQARIARYCLQNLPEYTSLVMETLERKQRLYHYRVPLEGGQNATSPISSPSEKQASCGFPEQNQELHRQRDNCDSVDHISSPGTDKVCESE